MGEKTVAQKLGLKAGKKLLITQQPEEVAALIGALPVGAELVTAGTRPSALILMFARDKAALVKGLPACKRQLEPGGALWVAYIKGTSGQKTDINRDSIREFVGTLGLDTVSQIALDDDWSALRLKVV
jgi:Protein of unknown function (DUF3052)